MQSETRTVALEHVRRFYLITMNIYGFFFNYDLVSYCVGMRFDLLYFHDSWFNTVLIFFSCKKRRSFSTLVSVCSRSFFSQFTQFVELAVGMSVQSYFGVFLLSLWLQAFLFLLLFLFLNSVYFFSCIYFIYESLFVRPLAIIFS